MDPIELKAITVFFLHRGQPLSPTPGFVTRGASAWNHLPANIVTLYSVAIFKRKLEENRANTCSVAPELPTLAIISFEQTS